MTENNTGCMCKRDFIISGRRIEFVKEPQHFPSLPGRNNPFDFISAPQESLQTELFVSSLRCIVVGHVKQQFLQNWFPEIFLNRLVKSLKHCFFSAIFIAYFTKLIAVYVNKRNFVVQYTLILVFTQHFQIVCEFIGEVPLTAQNMGIDIVS